MKRNFLHIYCENKPEFSKFIEVLEEDISLSENYVGSVGSYFNVVKESLISVGAVLEAHIKNIEMISEKWITLPRRGKAPDLRLLINANFDSKGNLVFHWSPFMNNQSDINACLTLITHNLGRDGNSIKIDKVRLLSELIIAKKHDDGLSDDEHDAVIRARNVLWSISLLQEIICSAISEKIDSKIGTRINFSYDGTPTIKDDYQFHYEKYLNWISNFSSRFQFDISNLVYFSEENYSPQQIRDYTKSNFLREMTYAEASNALKLLNDIMEYNNSVWRRTQPIFLPNKSIPEKVIPDNKLLVQKNGKAPRLSPIAIRGVEASNIVPTAELKSFIENRILENGLDWHFSAGDFIDFVELGGRGDIVTLLNRLKTKGDIVSVYKGIYISNINYADPVMALEALLRDRGELFISSYERSFCELGFQGNIFSAPLTFFTNGNLRNFYCLKNKIKLTQEPFPGFCEVALNTSNPNAFIACVSIILNGQINKYSELIKENGWENELKEAQTFLGRFY